MTVKTLRESLGVEESETSVMVRTGDGRLWFIESVDHVVKRFPGLNPSEFCVINAEGGRMKHEPTRA
jgi:hypothetical protein